MKMDNMSAVAYLMLLKRSAIEQDAPREAIDALNVAIEALNDRITLDLITQIKELKIDDLDT